MSLILEALKKSEANRRLGQAPDLGTPFAPARRERSPAWALLVIVLSLGAGLWWWFGRGASAPAPAKPPIAAASPAVPIQLAQPTHNSTPVTPAANVGGNAPSAHPDGQIWVAAQRRPDPPARTTEHSAPATPAMAQARPEPAPAPAAPAQPARAPKVADTRGYTPPPQPHPELAPTPATPKLDVPTYYDLPFATRKALPQLNLSMHVYTADPKRRFVILDGTRMAEGDTTSDSITVREIRPDGVILEFQGQRFFFPRDGL
ncbi:MAG: general secretion pathway protein GspB [Xanthomonadaceae bacterium]|nr:general secretion pathway protein GspB [Xanthomonadaceae bacterium]MDE2085216.1 general secretion pathway protein GspB [Xanthomonadaceae bacterium]